MPSWEFSYKNAILLRILLVGEMMFSVGLEKYRELTLIFRARRLFIPSPFPPSLARSQGLATPSGAFSPVLLPPPSSLARPSAVTLVRGWWSACRTEFFQQNSWDSWAELCCGFVCLSMWFTAFSLPCFRIWYPQILVAGGT